LAVAAKHAKLSHVTYEFNGALCAVLDRPDAEKAWLAGEDILKGVHPDPEGDTTNSPGTARLYELAFPD
jgi:hypothetical protein